jgi:DME family drug/metabolite transporter
MVVDPLGIVLSLGAGLSYAIFTLFSSRLVQRLPSDGAMAVSFCLGAILMLPTLLFVDTSWMVTSGGLVMLAHLGILATGLAYVFFGRGVRTVPVSVVGTLTLAEPLTAATLGILLLGERLTGNALLGLLVLFAGLMVLVLPRRKTVTQRLFTEGEGSND